MVNKGLLLALVFFLSGCVGTIRIAEENSGTKSKDLTTPTYTHSLTAKPKN